VLATANIAAGTGGIVLPGPARPADRICSETIELLLRSTGYNDDVTLLAAQRRTPTPPLHMALDATIHAARAVHARLCQWLLEIGADSADVSDVVHAISEFVENPGRRGVARRRWEPARLSDRPWADLGPSDHCRKPFRYSAFDDRSSRVAHLAEE
jgi:hypothetical protein